MERKALNSVVRILALKKVRSQVEAQRVQNGLTAGSALRERLLSSNPNEKYADVTTAYIQRTVGILDKGLAVLRQQHRAMVAAVHSADRASAVVQERINQSREKSERANLEADVGTSIAAETIRPKQSG